MLKSGSRLWNLDASSTLNNGETKHLLKAASTLEMHQNHNYRGTELLAPKIAVIDVRVNLSARSNSRKQ